MKLKFWARWKEGWLKSWKRRKENWKNDWYNRTIFILIVVCFGSVYGVGGLPSFDSDNLTKLIWSLISIASGLGVFVLIVIKEFWLDRRKKNNGD
jgi:hypothetical protein